jgi:hypothetical protein
MDTGNNIIIHNNKWCDIDSCAIIYSFFTRPQLSIECKEFDEGNIFGPARDDKKYLRIRVKNKGRRTAVICKAQLKVIEDEGDPMRYPSTDPKPLPWGRLLDLTDLQRETNIHPFIGEELLHVVFSAPWFTNEQPGIRHHRYAEISISDRIRGNQFREEDSFAAGNFIVEIIVTSEEVFTKAILRIHVEENFLNIRMKKLPWFEVLKYKFKRYTARIKARKLFLIFSKHSQ